MAISNNLLLSALSGTIAGQVTIKNYGHQVQVCKKVGKRSKKTTDDQKKNESHFKRGNNLAQRRYSNPVLREEARLRLKVNPGKELYRAMVKEAIAEIKATGQ